MTRRTALFATLFTAITIILFPSLGFILTGALDVPFFRHPLAVILGIVTLIIGCAMIARCSWLFHALGHGTIFRTEPPTSLVTEDLFARTRNPIYIGWFLVILGEFLITGAILILLYLVIFMAGVHLHHVRVEEPRLKKRFGNSYEIYLRSVPRWIPRRRRI